MTSKIESKINWQIEKQSNRITSAVLAILVGSFFIFGIGFTHSNTIHTIAHDARHAFAFPCH